MSQVLVKFDEPVISTAGKKYFAQAMGKEVKGGLWEGWLHFDPLSFSEPGADSDRETTQPNRRDVEYWAQGLTRVYLQGALTRALARPELRDVTSHSSLTQR